jgi:L-threonylcarbamoyladenylate synthase
VLGVKTPMKGCEFVSVDPRFPDKEIIRKAAQLIKKGGLVVFPTSTFYGLGAHAFDSDAVDSVFRAKQRRPQEPILVLIASQADLAPLVQSVPAAARCLIKAFWPGGLSLVFRASDVLPPNLTGYTGKIGIRLAAHPVARALVKAVGSPITGTSANLSGKGGCTTVSELNHPIRSRVDLVLDAGGLGGGEGSTVVDVTQMPPEILRAGVVSAEKIAAVLGRLPDNGSL